MNNHTKSLNYLRVIKLKCFLFLKRFIKQLQSLFIFSLIYKYFFKLKAICLKTLFFLKPKTKKYSILLNQTNQNSSSKNNESYVFLYTSSQDVPTKENFFYLYPNQTISLREAKNVIGYLTNTSKKISSPILLRSYNTQLSLINLSDDYQFKKNENLQFYDDKHNTQYTFKSKNTPNSTDQNNKVSIILTTFNDKEHILQALNSIQKQTYQNLEILVVDDCSKDNTQKMIESVIENDSRVHYFKMDKNMGTFFCRNYGLSHATGDFVTFHDSDDISRSDRIELCLQSFKQNKNLDVVYSNYIRINHMGLPIKNWNGSIYRNGLITLFIPLKHIQDKIGYFDPVRTSADSEFFERLFHLNLTIKKRDDVLYYARAPEKSLTQKGNFKTYTQKGNFVANPYREDYYFHYKKFQLNNNDLFIQAFETQRKFLSPYKMLSPLQKNCVDHFLPYLKKINHTQYKDEQVNLLVENKNSSFKSPLFLIQNNQYLPLVYVVAILRHEVFLETLIRNFQSQNHINKHLIIINATQKEDQFISMRMTKLINTNSCSLFSSNRPIKDLSHLLNKHLYNEDYGCCIFYENDHYASNYLSEQITFLNLHENSIVGKTSFLVFNKNYNYSFIENKYLQPVYFSKMHKHTLSFKKNLFLSLLENNNILLKNGALLIDAPKKAMVFSSSSANFINNQSSSFIPL